MHQPKTKFSYPELREQNYLIYFPEDINLE